MTPHLIWAFVALCALSVVAWREWRRDVRRALVVRMEALEGRTETLDACVRSYLLDNRKMDGRLDTIEADLKPLKAAHASEGIRKLGGAR